MKPVSRQRDSVADESVRVTSLILSMSMSFPKSRVRKVPAEIGCSFLRSRAGAAGDAAAAGVEKIGIAVGYRRPANHAVIERRFETGQFQQTDFKKTDNRIGDLFPAQQDEKILKQSEYIFILFPFRAEVVGEIDEVRRDKRFLHIGADGVVVVDDVARFDEREGIAAFSGKNDIGQGKRFKDVGKSFFASLGPFGDSLELAEVMTVEADN